MDTYLLMLLVTSEQEQAIRFLFEQRGWQFMKTGSRPPSKEELDYLYDNIVPEKQSDGDFRNLQPYLQLGYLEHMATHQYPAMAHHRQELAAMAHHRPELAAMAHHRPELASFSRKPALVYGVPDFDNRSSVSGQLYQPTDGASLLPACPNTPVQPAELITSVSSQEMLRERSPTVDSSVGCISKSLTILEKVGTGQYGENIVTEAGQSSTHSATLVNLDKTDAVSFTATQPGPDGVHKVNDQADKVNVTQSVSISVENQTIMSTSISSATDVSSIETTCVKAECEMNDVNDSDTNEQSAVSEQEVTRSEKSDLKRHHSMAVGPQPQMQFLKSVKDIVNKEFKDILKGCSIDMNQVGQELFNIILRELELKEVEPRDPDVTDPSMASERKVSHENDDDTTQDENWSENNREKNLSDDIETREGLEFCKGKVIANQMSLSDDIDDVGSPSKPDSVQLRNKVPAMVVNKEICPKQPKYSYKSTNKFVKKDNNAINQDSELKSNSDNTKNSNRSKNTNVYKTSHDVSSHSPAMLSARKHRWAVSRNIRMHSCHRKVKDTPADLDSNSYSVSERGYFCGACQFVFRTSRQLGLHRELKGGLCSPHCLYCDKDNFLADVHQCQSCPKCFKTRDLLDKHMERHRSQHHQCEFCKSSDFNSATELKLHIQSKHSDKLKGTHLCDLCGAKFNETKVLNAHRKYVHTDERPEVCKTCGYRFKTRSQLKNHMIKHKKLEDINLSCEVCGKLFMRVATLKDHVRRHKKEFVVYCPVCAKGFYQKYGLEEHMRAHTGTKPFACSECTYKCSLKCNLLKHMKTHSQKVS